MARIPTIPARAGDTFWTRITVTVEAAPLDLSEWIVEASLYTGGETIHDFPIADLGNDGVIVLQATAAETQEWPAVSAQCAVRFTAPEGHRVTATPWPVAIDREVVK